MTQVATTAPMAVSVAGAAAMMGLSKPTVWRMAARGELQTAKVGGRRLVLIASIRQCLGTVDESQAA